MIELPRRPLRPVSVRLDRRGGRPRAGRRLRARGPDQAALRAAHNAERRRQHARSSTRSRTSGSATAVDARDLDDIWFNEGWATVVGVVLGRLRERRPTARATSSTTLYDDLPDDDWTIAPADPRRRPGQPVRGFPVYDRGAMTLEGYRADRRRRRASSRCRAAPAERLRATATSRPRSSSTLAKDVSGFSGAELSAARRVLRAVALRRDEADDPARGLRR